jgi:3-mercaptopyruvate sulfurtransferase SseA
MFNAHGFTRVAVLQGGPQAWTAAGLPMEAPAVE